MPPTRKLDILVHSTSTLVPGYFVADVSLTFHRGGDFISREVRGEVRLIEHGGKLEPPVIIGDFLGDALFHSYMDGDLDEWGILAMRSTIEKARPKKPRPLKTQPRLTAWAHILRDEGI